MRFLLITLLFFLYTRGNSQINDIDFVINKIEKEYLPFLSPKYKNHLLKLNTPKEAIIDTFGYLGSIIGSFNNKHFTLYDFNYLDRTDPLVLNSRIESLNLAKNKKTSPKRFRGFWLNDSKNSIIGLYQDLKKNQLLGYLFESKSSNSLKPGMLVMILKRRKNGYLTDYRDPKFGFRVFTISKFKNDTTIIAGQYSKWKKIRSGKEVSLETMQELKIKTSIIKLDSSNTLITLPNFSASNVKRIDSMITTNKDIISRSKNLIIDIRYNIGGTILGYYPLLDYVYTNPIVLQGGWIFNTPEMIESIKKNISSLEKKGDTLRYYRKVSQLKNLLESKTGSFLIKGDTIRRDSTLFFPKKIAIIHNYACMSAAELMILDFSQSSKVTTFGEPTGGAVDYLDYKESLTPSGKYSLFIPTAKRYVIKNKEKIDGAGIIPNVTINENIENWVEFVLKYYEKD